MVTKYVQSVKMAGICTEIIVIVIVYFKHQTLI